MASGGAAFDFDEGLFTTGRRAGIESLCGQHGRHRFAAHGGIVHDQDAAHSLPN